MRPSPFAISSLSSQFLNDLTSAVLQIGQSKRLRLLNERINLFEASSCENRRLGGRPSQWPCSHAR